MFADGLFKNNPLVNTDGFKKHQETFEKKFGEYALKHTKSNLAVDNGLKKIRNSLFEQVKDKDINSKIKIFYGEYLRSKKDKSSIGNSLFYNQIIDHLSPEIKIFYDEHPIDEKDKDFTINMLKYYKNIVSREDDTLNFRLALIGLELSKNKNKSLYDLLKDSHEAGVVGSEDLTSIVSMVDSDISPLSKDEIKNNCFEEISFDVSQKIKGTDNLDITSHSYRLSPIDITFLERFAYNDNNRTNLNSIGNTQQSLFASPLDYYLDFLDNNVPLAMQAYVNKAVKAHYLINSYLGFRNVSNSHMMDKIFKFWAKNQLPSFETRNVNKKLFGVHKKMNSVLNDIKVIASTISGKLNSTNKYEGTTFRGDWISDKGRKNYKEGQIIKTSSFFSTSKNFKTAYDFADSNTLDAMSNKKNVKGAIMFVKLKGNSSVDISHVNQSEQEVLAVPGSKFKITKIYNIQSLPHNIKEAFISAYNNFFKDNTNDDKIFQDMFYSLNAIVNRIPNEISAALTPTHDKIIQANSNYKNGKINKEDYKSIKDSFVPQYKREVNTINNILCGVVSSFIMLEEISENTTDDN